MDIDIGIFWLEKQSLLLKWIINIRNLFQVMKHGFAILSVYILNAFHFEQVSLWNGVDLFRYDKVLLFRWILCRGFDYERKSLLRKIHWNCINKKYFDICCLNIWKNNKIASIFLHSLTLVNRSVEFTPKKINPERKCRILIYWM